MKPFYERFKDFFGSLSESRKVYVINEYNDANHYCGVFYMVDFDEIMSGKRPTEIISRCGHYDFNLSHRYFTCDANECFLSSDNALAWVDFKAMAKWYEDYDYILMRIDKNNYEKYIECED